MTGTDLSGFRILIVEDEYIIADLLASELEDAGAVVVGPVGTLSQATDLAEAEDAFDAAVLDVNLGGEMVFPLADLLASRQIPFVFTTGYDPFVIPSRFEDVSLCEKTGSGECPELCVSGPVHAVSDTQALKRSPNIMAN